MRTLAALLLAAAPAAAQDKPVPKFDFGSMGKIMEAIQKTGGNSMLLMNAGVQDELKLTDDQKKEVGDLMKDQMAKGFKLIGEINEKIKDVPEDKQVEKILEIVKPRVEETNKEVAKILKEDQVKRLKQIARQQAGVGAFKEDEVRKELALTDEQAKKIDLLVKELAEDVAEMTKGLTDPKQWLEVGDKMKKAGREAFDQAARTLTAEQKEKWKDLTGTPFEVKFEFGKLPFPKKD